MQRERLNLQKDLVMIKNSIFDSNVANAFSSFAMLGFDVRAVMAIQCKNLEALVQTNQLAIETMQVLARRQTEIAWEAFGQLSSAFGELTQPGAPQDKFAKHTESARAHFEKGLSATRELTELMTKSSNETFNLVTRRMTDSFTEFHDVASTKAA